MRCIATAIIILSVAALPALASSATIYVSPTGNDVTGDGSQGNPYQTIMCAIFEARHKDTIVVAPGTYYENLLVWKKSVRLTSTDPDNSAVVESTIISGGANSLPAVTLYGGRAGSSVVTGFTITGGEAPVGGGIFCYRCSPLITKNVITGNRATEVEPYTGGGGICCAFASPTISYCTISNNTSLRMGGGVACFLPSKAKILHCTFTSNQAGGGGGGISFLMASGVVSDCTFEDNDTTAWDGGAILVQWRAKVDISNCLIAGNSANGGGGICFIEKMGGSPSGSVRNCVIRNNFASYGGGGMHLQQTRRVDIINSLIAGNTCHGAGAGILAAGPGDTRVTNCTIVQNSSDSAYEAGGGLGIGWEHRAFVENNILWGNSCPKGPQVGVWQSKPVTFGFNDIQGDRAAFYEDNPKIKWLAGNTDVDPLFANPGSSGDGDYHLQSTSGRWDPSANAGAGAWIADLADSPCIDAGNPKSKFRNEPEPNGGRINMGAYGNTPSASKS